MLKQCYDWILVHVPASWETKAAATATVPINIAERRSIWTPSHRALAFTIIYTWLYTSWYLRSKTKEILLYSQSNSCFLHENARWFLICPFLADGREVISQNDSLIRGWLACGFYLYLKSNNNQLYFKMRVNT